MTNNKNQMILRRTYLEPDGSVVLSADNSKMRQSTIPPGLLNKIQMVGRVRGRWGAVDL